MLNFLSKKDNKKEKNNEENQKIILIACLMIHAAKMDENYTEIEKKIIIKALTDLYKKNENELDLILKKAEEKESESNQILEFTREVKKYDKEFRLKIIETLWTIIYSDGKIDMFESNLMRRLNALFYIDDRESGEIKNSIINLNKKK